MENTDEINADISARVKEVAIKMAEENGLINITRAKLCERARIPDGSFAHVMGCSFRDLIEELSLLGIKEPKHKVIKARAVASVRKEQILRTAVEYAKDVGYRHITREGLAERAGVSPALISQHLSTMNQLRNEIVRYAINNEVIEIVTQAVVAGHPKISKISSALRKKVKANLFDK